MSYMAWSMDRSLFGMRVQDVVRSVDYVASRADAGTAGVRAVGRGMGALWALYAAALDTRIGSVVCENGLLSYRTLTESDRYVHSASIFVRDVLRHFHLPQVAAAIADRPLLLLSPVDAMKRRVDAPRAQAEYQFTREVYGRAGASDRFRIEVRQDAERGEAYLWTGG
jgi:dienelactone hydrolase